MPEPLVHFAVPFALFTAKGMDVRKAALLSLIAVLPDLDVLIHVHRSYTHSIFIPIALLVAAAIWRRGSKPLVLASLSLATHSILDFVTYYTPILWPVYAGSLWLKASLDIHVASLPSSVKLSIQLLQQPASKALASFEEADFTAASGEGTLIALALVLTALIAKRAGRLRGTH